MIETALELASAGLSVIPVHPTQKKSQGKWEDFQSRIAAPDEIHKRFANAQAIAVIGGNVSGGFYRLDFEGKDHLKHPMRCIYPDFEKTARTELAKLRRPDLYQQFVVIKTPSNGRHVGYRVNLSELKGEKLASCPSGDLDSKGKPISNLLIESRGEGQYALVPPSPGYEILQGSLLDIPAIPIRIHKKLVEIAKSFHFEPQDKPRQAKTSQDKPVPRAGLSPGDDYNQRGDRHALLTRNGWQLCTESSRAEYWTRPGKSTKDGHSAVWAKVDIPGRTRTLTEGHFRMFSTADGDLEEGESCDLFGLYARLEHDGDFKKATRALAKEGYGNATSNPKPTQRIKTPAPDRPASPSPENRIIRDSALETLHHNETIKPTSPNAPESEIQFSDGWRAKQLVRLHGPDLLYCDDWGKWLVWDGKRWAIDRNLEIMRRAKSVTAKMLRDAARAIDEGDETASKFLMEHARKADTRAKYEAMISLARSEQGISILPDDLDQDPWRLTVENGTIDLQAGERVDHHREHLITKLAPVRFDARAKCSSWMDAMNLWMDGNQELIDFLQRAVGYSLTGRIHEQVLIILYGEGANGKTIFLETIMGMLGEYARHSEPDLLLMKRHENHPTGLADLMGARFVATTEIGEFARLHEPLVKRLTGGDKMKARYMRQDWFEFEPTHKLWIGVNHNPLIRGTDYGIWRRIRRVPFTVKIPEHQQIPRAILLEQFSEEWPGILNWAIEGCLEWKRDGLGFPESIRLATESYREMMDVVGRFINERCDISGSCQATMLYQAFRDWCEHGGERPVSQRVLGEKLAERGFEKTRSGAKGGFVWNGISVVSETPNNHEDFEVTERSFSDLKPNGHTAGELL